MTNDELRALDKTRHIQLIAWLTRDLDKPMQAWTNVLRIGPWRVFRFTKQTVRTLRVDGRPVEGPFEFRIAITHVVCDDKTKRPSQGNIELTTAMISLAGYALLAINGILVYQLESRALDDSQQICLRLNPPNKRNKEILLRKL